MSTPRFTRATKFLHFGLALSVTLQLLVAQIMEPPKPTKVRDTLEILGYELHEWIGMTAILFTVLHWLYSLRTRDDARLTVLFPWSGAKFAAIKDEVRALAHGQFSAPDQSGKLASLVHGLGFLAVTAMAVSGAILFVAWPETGAIPKDIKLVGEAHELMANAIWAYWVGHVGLSILHQIQGHSTLTDMMRLWRR
ncbi:MAG: cytochrome b/b6 domain-containing protein [Pseudomonadota bacterium]